MASVAPEQNRMSNPFGMDPSCTNCPDLAVQRSSVVHGFGDVGAEFLFVLPSPTEDADAAGHPLVEAHGFVDVLDRAGFLTDERDRDGRPRLDNAFVTHLTRCRHPDRSATDAEVSACDPFLTAEIRSINPEVLVPVGGRPLRTLATEYTTRAADELEVHECHATAIRGRGFELLPMVDREDLTPDLVTAFLDTLDRTLGRDYRQTKGRRGR